MLKWMYPSRNESSAFFRHLFLLIMVQWPPAVQVINGEYIGQHPPPPIPSLKAVTVCYRAAIKRERVFMWGSLCM